MRKKSIRANKETKKQEKSLESWIWDAACSILGAKDAPKYKDYILPLIFTKRLCLDDVEADIIAEGGGLLIKCEIEKERGLSSRRKGKEGGWKTPSRLKPFGQEYIADTRAMACMNMIIHDMEGEIEIGDTFKNPRFRDKRGKLRTSDRVVANPMWNQDWLTEADYEADEFGRFPAGARFSGKEEEKLSRIVDDAELKKNDYNTSPSLYFHASNAETYRPIAGTVLALKAVESEARETDRVLQQIPKKPGV